MKRLLLLSFALIVMQMTFGQLTGTKTIPGDYATIEAAISALNAQGVGSGGVTFNVAAGHTETFTVVTAGKITTTTGSSTNTIVFQKSGSGSNPLVTAPLNGTGTADYIFCIAGTDYITFDGISIQENTGNTTTTTQAEWGYAILKASATDGSQNVTVKNCNISLNKTNTATYGIYSNNVTPTAPTTQLTVTAASGANSNNKFYNNALSNTYGGIYLNGFADATSPYAYYDQGNDIGSVTGNTLSNFAGGASTAYGMYIAYQNSLTVANSNISGGASTTGAIYGIYFGTSTNASGSIYGNTISLTSGGTTSYIYCFYNSGFGTTGTSNTLNIFNNTIQNCTYPTATTAYFYALFNGASAFTSNLYNNTVTNNLIDGSNYMYLMYTTSASGGTANIYNNTLSNNQRTGLGTQSGTSVMYCMYVIGSASNSIHDNNIFGNSIGPVGPTYGAGMYSLYCSNSSPQQNIYNNSIHDQTITSTYTSSCYLYGIYSFPASTSAGSIYNNSVYNLTIALNSTSYGYIYGLYSYYQSSIYGNTLYNLNVTNVSSGYGYGYGYYINGSTSSNNIYKNKLYGVTMAGTSGYFYGMYIGSGVTMNVYNNYISEINAPASTSTSSLNGIYIAGGTNVNLYYNTIYLDASSTSATTFTSSGIYASTTPTVELRDNIVINKCTAPASTTYSTAAYRRSSTTLTTYAAASNNNDFFAGTPSANNLIYTDGTNSDQTLAAYKTRVSPRDASSVTENPPFVNVATTPYNLHIQTTILTQCESGGSTVSSPVNIIDDYDVNPRYPNAGYPNNGGSPASAPDIGADEFGGLLLDLTAPNISFTALGNTVGTGARTLTTAITDATGVPTAGIGLPVLYWKINSGAYTPVTATYVSGSTYTFTFGAGVVLGDVVSYYIVAQDLVSPTPNIGSNPSGGASGFTIDPPACSTPPTTPYSYTIVVSLSGTFTVGASGNYASLTGAGGLFADINSKVITGNITAQIISNLTEDGSNALNQIAEEPTGSNFTITIQPNSATLRTISGSYTGGLIRLNGADRVTFDGRYGGSGNYLTFTNTAASGTVAVFQLISLGSNAGATNNTIRNCNINVGFNASGSYGIVSGGATVASTGADNDNNTIQANSISKAYVGIWAQGSAVSNPGLMDNLQILGNSVGAAATSDYIGHDGIIVANGTGGTISQNTIYNIITAATTPVGITLSTGFVSATVSRNKINNITYTGTGGYGGRGMYINTGSSPSNLTIDNNLIYVIGGDGWSTFAGTSMVGMYFDGSMAGLNIYFNSVYMSGNYTRASVTLTTAILFNTTTITGINLRNNIFQNSMDNTGMTTDINYAIYSTAPSTSFTDINYNDYYVTGGQGVLGYLGGDKLTMAAWRTATGKDVYSINADPIFTGTTDLRIGLGSAVLAAGTPIAGIDYDYENTDRSNTNPSMGAYETGGDYAGPTITYTLLGNTTSTANRLLSPVTITDYSGVNTSSGTRPRVYYKRSTDGNVWNNNTSGSDGWKWVEASGTTSPFSFTIDYSLLNGGTGITVGTIVQYFVIAQDLQATPLVSINSGTFATTPSSVALTSAAFPITGTINSYQISAAISGTILVGTAQTYTSLTADATTGLFKAINNGVLTSNITVIIVSDLAETGAIALNQMAEEPTGSNFTLTIQPNAATLRTISGSYTGGLIRLNGADRVTFDGRYGGGGNYLTFTNTVTTGTVAVFQLISLGSNAGATNNTIRNCNINVGFNTSGSYGIVSGGATVAITGADNDNNTIQANNVSKAYVGIWAQGTAATNPGAMDNLQILSNSVGSATSSDYIGHDGIIVANGTGGTISQNTIYNIITTSTTPVGLTLSTGFISASVSRNKINNITYTSTGGYGGRGMYISTGNATSNLTIDNNLIYVIGGDGYSSFANSSPVGMYFDGVTGGLNIYFNSVYMSGNLTYSSTTLTTAILFNTTTITNINLRNNIFQNSMDNGPLTTDKNFAIYSTAPASSFTDINYNDYYVTGAQGILGFLGADQLTLAAWQAATGKDANSKNLDPLFASTTDLHPSATGIDNQGTYLPALLTDYAGIARTNPPDMGAYEFGTNPAVTTTAATGMNCGGGTLNGTINANGLTVNSFFDYGLTTAYGSSVAGTPAIVTGTTPTAISTVISMPTSTTYHYRARGVTSTGVTVYGNDLTITSSGPGAPVATTMPATDIANTTATLNGTVIASCNSTTVTFEYGLTASYGFTVTADQSPVNGAAVTPVSKNITGLSINTMYHFRVVASSTAGTTYGVDLTFTTGAAPPIVTTNPATNIGNFTARLNGTVNANNQSTTVTFQWGLTASYGNTIAGIPGTVTGTTPTAVYADISSLNYNTAYHFRCVGVNSAGTTYGADQVFTTLCPIPEAAGAITGPTSVCASTSGHVYTVPPITYAYAGYVWALPPGGTITGGAGTNSITVSYNSAAVSGNVTVYGTSVCGNGTPSSLAVTVNPPPVPVITGPTQACITSSYIYSTEDGMSGYVWTVSAGGQIMAGAGTDSVTVKWNNAGAQYVTVNYISMFGCPAAAPTTLNVTVGNLTTPTIAGSNMMCVNTGLYVYTTQTGYSNYVWTVTSGGTIVTGQGTYQIEVNWTLGGAQTVTVNYANSYGCSAASPATFAVTVKPLPGTPGEITGTHELCAGTQHVSYSVPPIPNALDYIWNLPAGATIVSGEYTNNIQVDFALDASSGNILVLGENLCGRGPSSPMYPVTVNPIPTTPVASVDEFFMLHSDAPAGNQWYFEGVMIDGANGQDYQAEAEGSYWTIVTLNECVSDESNHVEVIFTGLDDLKGASFSIFPIPNDGKFTVSVVIPGEETFSINVYNNLGVKVYEMKDFLVNGKAQQTIDLNKPSTGIYTVVFQGTDHAVIRKVLVTK